jgi:carbon monoxide dehydrogenase subunit G
MAGISVALDGTVEMVELNAPDEIQAVATANDTQTNSRLDAEAEMMMNDADQSGTELQYTIDLDFTGRLANLGARIVKRKISSDINTFFENIKQESEQRPTST